MNNKNMVFWVMGNTNGELNKSGKTESIKGKKLRC